VNQNGSYDSRAASLDCLTRVLHGGGSKQRRAHGSEPAPMQCGSPVASPGDEAQISKNRLGASVALGFACNPLET